MFPTVGHDFEDLVASDVTRIAEVIGMAIVFTLELWAFLPGVKQANSSRRLAWMETLMIEAAKHGGAGWDTVDNAREGTDAPIASRGEPPR